MSKEVLIFLYMDDKHPGYIADHLQKNNIAYRVVRGYAGDPIPPLVNSMASLVFMGGVMSANDDIPWIRQEIVLIRAALDNHIPLLGHCLGGQLISIALGASVTANLVGEVGWHRCTKQVNPQASKWLEGIDDLFMMFHWHFETFELPEKSQLLFSSDYCQNQAYSYGDNVLAMQGHVEMTKPLLTDWIIQWRDDLQATTPSIQNYQQIAEPLAINVAALN